MGAYLFLLLFISLYGHLGFQLLNQIILWVFGPLLSFYILESKLRFFSGIPREYYWYLSMVIFAFLGYLNIVNFDGFYRYLQVLIANFVLMVTVYFAASNKREWQFFWKVVGLAGLCVAGLSFLLPQASMSGDQYFRLEGLVGNANGTADYSRVAIIAALIWNIDTKSIYMKMILWAAIAFLSYTIILTASRATFANLVFILGGYFLLNYIKGWKVILLLVAIYILGPYLLSLFEDFLSNFYLFDRLTKNDTLNAAMDNEARIQLYKIAWETFIENPFLGVGLNQFKVYSEGKISHTDILDILVQLGIFAGIVYTAIYVKCFSRLLKVRKYLITISDWKLYRIILLAFISEVAFGFSNPNWFTQIQMIVLSLIIIYVVKVVPHQRGKIINTVH